MTGELERLAAALRDRYRIERELGSGGMGTVFLAEDRKHLRQVALKVLRPALAHTIGVERFLREVQVLARLQHPHIITLIDSGEVDGVPYYVMPHVEGESLEALVRRSGPLPLVQAVNIVREIADGLHYAHQHDVVHRDIKPANILLSDGHAMISDFGIAAALDNATVGRITETGISLGSPLYMSPEQAAGERDLDARTDIYSLGCVLYELLAGAAPLAGGSMQSIVTRKLVGEIPPIRQVRSDIPAGVEAVLARSLAAERADRFESARAFADALAELVAARPARRRSVIPVAIAAVAFIAVAALFAQTRSRSERQLWLAQQFAEIERLAGNAQYAAAFVLARELEAAVRRDTVLDRLRPLFADLLPINTDPPGARVYVQRYDMPEDDWEFVGITPIAGLAVPKLGIELPMRLRIEADGYRTVELLPHVLAPWSEYRNLPARERIVLDRDDAAPAGMVRIPGFTIADLLHPGADSLRFNDYYMDRFEVSNRDFKAFVDAGGYRNPEYWTEPFVEAGRQLSWPDAIARFTDQTGRPGPATWRLGTYPAGEDELPVGGVSWYEAMAYARFVGKVLPTTSHWGFAALRYIQETSWIVYPRSNLGGPGPRRVGAGRGMNEYGLYDIAGNVREWMANPMEGGRATRGAAWNDPEFQVGWLIPRQAFDRDPTHGFRLMQHFDHDSVFAHAAIERRRPVTRDYRGLVPATDAEYRIFQRLYDYDRTPLNARVDAAGSNTHYDWQKISFDPPYDGRRAGAWLFFPKRPRPPLQAVIYWPGSLALDDRAVDHGWIDAWTGFVPRSGRVLVLPLYDGLMERDDENFSITWASTGARPNTSHYREFAVRWIKDLRRTLDYLETRDDVDPHAFGFFGFSWGGLMAPIVLAVEPRISAAVLDVGGLWTSGPAPLPEVEPFHFLPRVTTPVLMVNGRHDQVFPYETAQIPFFEFLGTPPEHKRHYVVPVGHLVPRDEMIREALAWYDRFLGVP